MTTYTTYSPGETQEVAEKLATKLKAGDILALYGDLGAGKTTFVQGLARSLNYNGRVFSPTFIFVRPYPLGKQKADSGKQRIKTLYHIDLYRVEEPSDLKTIGIEEFLNDPEAVSVIEWPEKIEESLPAKVKKIKFEIVDTETRKISVAN